MQARSAGEIDVPALLQCRDESVGEVNDENKIDWLLTVGEMRYFGLVC